MYDWFNQHLKLGLEEPVLEEDFKPLTQDEYTVWNDEHPKPPGDDEYERELTRYMAAESDKQIARLTPSDERSQHRFREVLGGALRTIIGRDVPSSDAIARTKVAKQQRSGYLYFEEIVRLNSHDLFERERFLPTAVALSSQLQLRHTSDHV